MTAQLFIEQLGLKKHQEGGYYKRTYSSGIIISKNNLPDYAGDRFSQTAIYYLLEGGEVSKFHKLKSDEIWFFHAGSSLTIYMISEQNKLKTIQLGSDIKKGDLFQVPVPAETWFAAEVNDKSGFSFVSCTVSPGFDFEDFEIADKLKLSKEFSIVLQFPNKFFSNT